MKTFVAALILTLNLTAVANAGSPVILASVDSASQTVERISMDSNGKIEVQLRGGHKVEARELSGADRDQLYYDSLALADAAVQTTGHEFVCMAMVMLPSSQPVLRVSNADANGNFTGELREVLSEDSCAMRSVTAPVTAEMRARAQEMREALTALGNETAQTAN